jgi:hypothetical protein
MRKLMLLLAALLLIAWGRQIIAGADFPAPYIWRDGLLLLALGALIFGLNVGPLPPVIPRAMLPAWTVPGRLLTLAGAGILLLATILAATAQPLGLINFFWLAGALLLVAGVLLRGPQANIYAPPAYRWNIDAAGHYVRLALAARNPNQPPAPDRLGRWLIFAAFGLGLLIAGYFRLAHLLELPPGCAGDECARALRLLEDEADFSLLDQLAGLLSLWMGDPLYSLRLTGAFLALLMVFFFVGMARLYAGPTAILLAALLLAFSPWAVAVGRVSEPWVVAGLSVMAAFWGASQGVTNLTRRSWMAAGLGIGIALWVDARLWPGALLWLWILALFALSGFRVAGWSVAVANVGALMGGVLLRGPGIYAAARNWSPPPFDFDAITGWAPLLNALLHGDAASFLGEEPLVGGVTVVLAVAGIGVWLRWINDPRALLALATLLVWANATTYLDLSQVPPATALLLWLPMIFLGVAVALGQIITYFDLIWRPVVPVQRVIALLLAGVIVLGIQSGLRLFDNLQGSGAGATTSADVAIARYLVHCLGSPSTGVCAAMDPDADVYIPASLFSDPAARLQAGPVLDASQVRALDLARDLLPGAQIADRLYLLPVEEQQVIDLLYQLYPGGVAEAPILTEPGPTYFVAYYVPQEDLLRRQGLQGFYFQSDRIGEPEDALLVWQDRTLAFDWATNPPLPSLPFSVLWEGSLLAPVAGEYLFTLALDPGTEALVTVQLDGALILDSSLDLLERRQVLAQGPYHLQVRFRTSTAPPNWALQWLPPGGSQATLAAAELFSPPLPTIGLLGEYTAGNQWQGPLLAQRKDLVLGAPVDLPAPYSVRWSGKMAASRSGEYIFSVAADGPTQLMIDGRTVIDYIPNLERNDSPDYTQAAVYLLGGWRDIEVRYAPAANRPAIRLLWQPPGSSPELLRSRYLLPMLGDINTGDIELPPPPGLLDPRLGDGRFALTQLSDFVQPQVSLPAVSFPPLFFEPVWSVGRCGAGAGQLDTPHGLALDVMAGRIYVADTGNRRIVALALADGAPLDLYSADGFEEVVDVALDQPPGAPVALLALDAVAHQIYRIDPTTGASATVPLTTGFYRPRGLAVDENGYILVADTGGARVVLLDHDGQQLGAWGGLETALGRGQPVDVLAQDGAYWAITAEDGRLWRLDVLGSVALFPRVSSVNGPHLAALPGGGFFVTDPGRRAVIYHTVSGEPLGELPYTADLVAPTGVAAGVVEEMIYVAASDSVACTVSLWRTPRETLLP